MKPIGILGGTFDPIHHGHLRLAIECYERLDLHEVRLIPLHTPPHRNHPIASPEQRLAMLHAATRNITGLSIDDSELQRNSISYTIDTLTLLREQLGDTPLCLLLGADAFNALHTWRRWNEIINYCHIVLTRRLGNEIMPENAELKNLHSQRGTTNSRDLHQHAAGKIFEIEIPLLDISATQIRELISNKRDPAFLLPAPVLEYIQTHNLYGTT